MTIHSSGSVWAGFVRQAAQEVDALPFRGAGWTSTYPGHGEISPGKSGTANRGQYAVDFMVSNKAAGDKIAAYLWANRKRLGVRYVIWNRRIISETNKPSQWRRYTNPVPSRRGTASGDHTNHPHASFFSNGSFTPLKPQKPPVPATPDPAGDYPRPDTTVVYVDKMAHGQTNSASVYWVQRRLRELGYDTVLKTGTYDDATEAGARAFQLASGNDPQFCDGIIGPLDLAALFKGSDPAITIEAES